MSYSALELLLRQTVGLDGTSISPTVITRAIQARMAECGVVDTDAYSYLVRTSENELQELIEAVVVPETWFFRDREAFATLARLVSQTWASLRPDETLRLLSLPCSTGEEPHSMAMALFDVGLPPQRFQIDAIDISHRALTHAQRGIYGKNSFRGGDIEFRDRYFEATSSGWLLMEKVRRQVRFEQGNLISGNLLPGLHLYDIIFCRNVLIYFDCPAQERVVAMLERLLVPEGILFMGPSETSLLSPLRFVSARLSHTFAFRKTSAEDQASKEKPRIKSGARESAVRAFPVTPAPTKPRPFSPPPTPPPVTVATPAPLLHTLDEALRLANQGRLSEASTLCETCLQQEGPSARAYSLLGLIHDATRRTQEATEFYRKALYLDPQNEEVLTHLASLLKSQGDLEGAHRLFDRARRLISRQS